MNAFRFKQFEVAHDKCAMKVGTDGVLLGAWAKHSAPQSILDIGTGSGLIALQLAQRFSAAKITGIDIDSSAVKQANQNFKNSTWSKRLIAIKVNLDQFEHPPFDLIVSNPPFFNGTYTSGNQERDTARQNTSLSPTLLFQKVSALLATDGHFCCIIPTEHKAEYISIAASFGVFLNQELRVKGHPNKPYKRELLQFSKQESELISDSLTIETDKRHEYTAQYLTLVKDFYLFA
jgi:tRNA1Val (adenine37-N6)-methyltransferase